MVPSGTWGTLASNAPGNVGTMMLLSDGTVLAQQAGISSTWYQLVPQGMTGNYVNGTWNTRASMNVPRLFYASNVLPSGKVFVEGGEYTNPQTSNTATYDNRGEIYDPVANTWSSITNFPQTQFGDDPSAMLPGGDVLTGYLNGPQTYIYNPSTNAWSTTATKLSRTVNVNGTTYTYTDPSDEESWVKLPDGSILSYDEYTSANATAVTGTTRFYAERYNPNTDKWVDASSINAANAPGLLSGSNVGWELGADLLLPNGKAMYLGGNGNTAFYSPSADQWSAGPALPSRNIGSPPVLTQLGADDAPAAVMPNGDVLMALSPVGTVNAKGQYSFPSGTFIYEFNPTNNTYTDVTPSGFGSSINSYQTRMLVLPSGQVLLSDQTSSQVDVFTPDGAPNDAWRPVITDITRNDANTATLSGTQLTGISEGAAYGDDAEMSSNYPIIQYSNGLSTAYMRSFNWDNTGVATGSERESVQLPLAHDAPLYYVSAIANGIASLPVLAIEANANFNNITLRRDPTLASELDIQNGSVTVVGVPFSEFSRVIVTGDVGVNTSLKVDYTGGFFDTPVSFDGGSGGTNTLTVTDATDSRSAVWTEHYGLINIAPANDAGGSVAVDGTVASITLDTNAGGGTVSVVSTDVATTINSYGPTTVYVGNDLRLIGAPISIANPPSYTTLNVYDTGEPADPGSGPVPVNMFTQGNVGTIEATGPQREISYVTTDVSQVNFFDNGTDHTFTIDGTASSSYPGGTQTNVYTGTSNNTVQVNATAGPLSIFCGYSPTVTDHVTIGSATTGLDNINGSVNVNESGSFHNFALSIDDSHSAVVASARLNYVFDRGAFQRTDKAPIVYSGIQSVTFTENPKNVSDFTVRNTNPGGNLSLNNVGGADRVFVQNTTAGPLSITNDFSTRFNDPTFKIGPNLGNIQNAVAIHNPGGSNSQLILDDTAATTSRQLNIVGSASAASLQISGAAAISVDSGQFYGFAWYGGSHGNVVHVHGNPAAGSAYFFGGGTDSLYLSATAGNRISNLQTIGLTAGSGGPSTVVLDDSDEMNAQTYTVTQGHDFFGNPLVHFTTQGTNLSASPGATGQVPTFVLKGSSSGNNTLVSTGASAAFRVSGTNAGSVTYNAGTTTFTGIQNLTDGASNDTFTFSNGASLSGTLTGGGGSNTLNLGASTANLTVNVTAANAGNVPGVVGAFTSIQNVTTGSGSDSFVFSDGASLAGTVDGGSGTNTLDESAYSTAVTVNLAAHTATGVGGTIADLQTFLGGTASNMLLGPNTATTWNITAQNAGTLTGGIAFTAFQNLTGGSANDTFVLSDGAGVDGNLDGGGGTNFLDYLAYTTSVAVDLTAGTATGVGGSVANFQQLRGGQSDDTLNGNAAGTTTFFAGPGNDTITGAGGTNTLVGTNADSLWSVNAQDSGTLTFGSSTTTFSGIQNLTGGSGNDTFVLSDGVGVDGNIDGGGGTNTLDESAYTSSVTVNLSARTATGVGGTIANLQKFIGAGAGGSTLQGPNTAATWNITAQNGGTLTGGVSFSAFQNLAGGSAADTFVLANGAGVDGNIDGGGGTNTLDESAYTSAVAVDLSALTATGVGGNIANVQRLVGGSSAANTLGGPGTATTWNLSGSNAGTLTGGYSFNAFGNITGGGGDNTFVFADGAGITGTLTAVSGTNTLDYSAYRSSVIVDLQANVATGVGGLSGTFANVHGGNSSGSGLYNLLIGSGGNTLTGGTSRRNILVAGSSSSTLIGGTQDDLLIGGTANYDTEANLTSWKAIAAYWAGSDSYTTRVTNLENGNGVPLLDATTVTGNGGSNTMTGSSELALIYTDGADTISNLNASSQTVTISP